MVFAWKLANPLFFLTPLLWCPLFKRVINKIKNVNKINFWTHCTTWRQFYVLKWKFVSSPYSEEFVLGSRPPRIFEIVSNWKISNHQILLKDGINDDIKLHCHVEDGTIPKPAIQWYKDGNVLENSMEGFDTSETNVIRFLGKFIY